ncbi:MAG: hypothetical protein IJ123_06780 [Blautia sp.]|nr:hypothetical protein [Blautia sp.]
MTTTGTDRNHDWNRPENNWSRPGKQLELIGTTTGIDRDKHSSRDQIRHPGADPSAETR